MNKNWEPQQGLTSFKDAETEEFQVAACPMLWKEAFSSKTPGAWDPPPKQGVSQHSCPSWLACQEMLPGLLQILFFFQHTKNLITLLICSINYMLKWYYFGNIWLTHWIYFTFFIFFFNEERKFYSPNGKKKFQYFPNQTQKLIQDESWTYM